MTSDGPADRPSDAASNPTTPTDTPPTTETWPLLDTSNTTPTDTPTSATWPLLKPAHPPATESRWRRWGGRIAGVLVALAFVFVPLPSSGWLLWNVGRVFHVDVMPIQVYWEDLQPGMCVREDPNGTDYLVVDCNAEHQEEVISRSTLASVGWPGDAAVEDMAGGKCKPAFATYVGLELDESRLDFDFVTPDESGWNSLKPIPVLRWPMIGRATLICTVWDPDHDQITRALRGAHE
jgi:putative regulator of septum formation